MNLKSLSLSVYSLRLLVGGRLQLPGTACPAPLAVASASPAPTEHVSLDGELDKEGCIRAVEEEARPVVRGRDVAGQALLALEDEERGADAHANEHL